MAAGSKIICLLALIVGAILGGFIGYRIAGGTLSDDAERTQALVGNIQLLEGELLDAIERSASLERELGEAGRRVGDLIGRNGILEARLRSAETALDGARKYAENIRDASGRIGSAAESIGDDSERLRAIYDSVIKRPINIE